MLRDIKTRIRTAQVKAAFAANQEMILLYWDVGWTVPVLLQHPAVILQPLVAKLPWAHNVLLCKRSKICQSAPGKCKLRFNTDGVVMCWP